MKVTKERINSNNHDEVNEWIKKAKLTLLKNQKYSIIEGSDSLGSYDIRVEKEALLKYIDFEER